MSNDFLKDLIASGETAFAPLNELNDVVRKAVEDLSAQQMEIAREYMELGVQSMQMLSEAKDPESLVEAQLKLAEAYRGKLTAQAEAFAKLAGEAQAQSQKILGAWAEHTLANVPDAPSAPKPKPAAGNAPKAPKAKASQPKADDAPVAAAAPKKAPSRKPTTKKTPAAKAAAPKAPAPKQAPKKKAPATKKAAPKKAAPKKKAATKKKPTV